MCVLYSRDIIKMEIPYWKRVSLLVQLISLVRITISSWTRLSNIQGTLYEMKLFLYNPIFVIYVKIVTAAFKLTVSCINKLNIYFTI